MGVSGSILRSTMASYHVQIHRKTDFKTPVRSSTPAHESQDPKLFIQERVLLLPSSERPTTGQTGSEPFQRETSSRSARSGRPRAPVCRSPRCRPSRPAEGRVKRFGQIPKIPLKK
eukprot:6211098-Pleurochrysis_carterae.AAC.3